MGPARLLPDHVWRVSWISADPYQSNKATREAISLAPWLQPGGQVLQNNSLNRFQRFLLILLTKTLETVPCQFRFAITGLKPRCNEVASRPPARPTSTSGESQPSS